VSRPTKIPGYRITQVHSDVFGLIVQPRNYFSNLGASFRTLAGGEVAGYNKLLTESRNQARERMWRETRTLERGVLACLPLPGAPPPLVFADAVSAVAPVAGGWDRSGSNLASGRITPGGQQLAQRRRPTASFRAAPLAARGR
jgi:hypothetical protein